MSFTSASIQHYIGCLTQSKKIRKSHNQKRRNKSATNCRWYNYLNKNEYTHPKTKSLTKFPQGNRYKNTNIVLKLKRTTGKCNHTPAIPLLSVSPREALARIWRLEKRTFSTKESCKSKIGIKKTKKNEASCPSLGVFTQWDKMQI